MTYNVFGGALLKKLFARNCCTAAFVKSLFTSNEHLMINSDKISVKHVIQIFNFNINSFYYIPR